MPKIPGSREDDDKEISIRLTASPVACSRRNASTSRPSRSSPASRLAAEIRRQLLYRTRRTARSPPNHNPARRTGRRSIRLGKAVEVAPREVVAIVACVRGWLTCSTAEYSPDFVTANLCDDAKWLPIAVSSEKGNRNFTDAASQSR